ncbi:hypothetical protein ACVOMS_29715 [Bradyrhizobium guangxiense]
MKKEWQDDSIAGAIDEAHRIISELAEEMQEAFDALPEHFKDYHVRRREAAEWLEVASDSLCGLAPTGMNAERHQIRWLAMRAGKDGKLNRPARRDNVVKSLQACIFRLAEIRDEEEDALKLIGELKRIRDTLKSIEFPGMSI